MLFSIWNSSLKPSSTGWLGASRSDWNRSSWSFRSWTKNSDNSECWDFSRETFRSSNNNSGLSLFWFNFAKFSAILTATFPGIDKKSLLLHSTHLEKTNLSIEVTLKYFHTSWSCSLGLSVNSCRQCPEKNCWDHCLYDIFKEFIVSLNDSLDCNLQKFFRYLQEYWS